MAPIVGGIVPIGRTFLYSVYADRPPSLDSGLPPAKIPQCSGSGNYCFRVTQEYVDHHDNIERIFTGYDDDFSIVDKVQEHCDLHKKKMGRGECGDSKLYFIGPHPKCDGRVEVDIKKNDV